MLGCVDNKLMKKIFGGTRISQDTVGDSVMSSMIYDSHQTLFRLTKSGIKRWAGHVARRGQERCTKGFSG